MEQSKERASMNATDNGNCQTRGTIAQICNAASMAICTGYGEARQKSSRCVSYDVVTLNCK